MQYPSTSDDFVCELEAFLHNGFMNEDMHKFFEDFVQSDFRKWGKVCGSDAINGVFSNLQLFLSISAQLYAMDDFSSLIVNGLLARHFSHQMQPFGQHRGTSGAQADIRSILEGISGRLNETDDLEQAAPKELVFAFFEETPNKYLLINLLLCVLKEGYQDAYQDYVKGKVSRFLYSFAFWRPMNNLFEPNCPMTHILWLDMLGDLVSPKPSDRAFQEMFAQMDHEGE